MSEYMTGEMRKQFVLICNTFAPDPFVIVSNDVLYNLIEFSIV